MGTNLYCTCGTLSSSHYTQSHRNQHIAHRPSRPARTYRFDLGVVLKHDLVLVVDVAKLLLGDIHPGPGDIVDFSFLQLFVEVVDGLVEPGSFDLGLDRQQDRD
jgi:hypothetical protein